MGPIGGFQFISFFLIHLSTPLFIQLSLFYFCLVIALNHSFLLDSRFLQLVTGPHVTSGDPLPPAGGRSLARASNIKALWGGLTAMATRVVFSHIVMTSQARTRLLARRLVTPVTAVALP